MKKLVLLELLLIVCLGTFSQNKELILRKSEGNFYLEHKVVSKDNFYSIGRLYNVSAKHIASFNKIDMNKGLDIDQKLRIPLTDSNFTMTGNSGTPVFYRAGLNTTLTRISEAYHNVPVASLKYWNQRQEEEVAEGEKLIIGFVKSEKLQSITLNHPVPNEEPVKTEPVTAKLTEEKPVIQEVVKEEGEPKGEEPSREIRETKTEEPGSAEHGYFKTSFDQQARLSPTTKNQVVSSGIFKTKSGWEDEKYYVLVDNVEPGTIVKLENPENHQVAYAKVLGEMSSIRLNQNLDVRISNAAASVLKITDPEKFVLKMSY